MKNKSIPILKGHDHRHVIGKVEIKDGKMYFEFSKDVKITRKQFFEIFGNVGVVFSDYTLDLLWQDEDINPEMVLINKGEILEFSL